MIKKFDKLVRDKIPEIVTAEGNTYVIEIPTNRYVLRNYAGDKIIEEANEVIEADTRKGVLSELGDLLAVMIKFGETWDIKPHEILIAMSEKEQTHGGFTQNHILKEIDYKDE